MSFFETFFNDKHEFKNLELTLSRIDSALKESDIDFARLGKVIHIAGTNGKGSTSLFLSQILQKNGLSTALFTSPHIIKINERLNFNSEDITDAVFDDLFIKSEKIIEKYKLSYFEAIFYIAVIWFASKRPDVTILETGLGGRFDATNTWLINDKTCVITSISQDHAEILGHNIFKITDEKLGIIRPFSKVFLAHNKPFIEKYIKSKIKNDVISITPSVSAADYYEYPYSENYDTAKITAERILSKQLPDYPGLSLPPCRLEKIDELIFDGSHNMAGVMAIAKSELLKHAPVIIFTSTNERCPANIFNILAKISQNIILTTIPGNPRSISEKEAASVGCRFIAEPEKALEAAKLSANGAPILITGSFYLCSYIKKMISKAKI